MIFRERTTACHCNDGKTYYAANYAGERIGELVEQPCDDCEGTGIIEAGCAHCEHVVPLDDEGFCDCCASIPDDVGLTETRPDPFYGEAA